MSAFLAEGGLNYVHLEELARQIHNGSLRIEQIGFNGVQYFNALAYIRNRLFELTLLDLNGPNVAFPTELAEPNQEENTEVYFACSTCGELFLSRLDLTVHASQHSQIPEVVTIDDSDSDSVIFIGEIQGTPSSPRDASGRAVGINTSTSTSTSTHGPNQGTQSTHGPSTSTTTTENDDAVENPIEKEEGPPSSRTRAKLQEASQPDPSPAKKSRRE